MIPAPTIAYRMPTTTYRMPTTVHECHRRVFMPDGDLSAVNGRDVVRLASRAGLRCPAHKQVHNRVSLFFLFLVVRSPCQRHPSAAGCPVTGATRTAAYNAAYGVLPHVLVINCNL